MTNGLTLETRISQATNFFQKPCPNSSYTESCTRLTSGLVLPTLLVRKVLLWLPDNFISIPTSSNTHLSIPRIKTSFFTSLTLIWAVWDIGSNYDLGEIKFWAFLALSSAVGHDRLLSWVEALVQAPFKLVIIGTNLGPRHTMGSLCLVPSHSHKSWFPRWSTYFNIRLNCVITSFTLNIIRVYDFRYPKFSNKSYKMEKDWVPSQKLQTIEETKLSRYCNLSCPIRSRNIRIVF